MYPPRTRWIGVIFNSFLLVKSHLPLTSERCSLNLAGSHGIEAFVALFAAAAEDGGGGQQRGRDLVVS